MSKHETPTPSETEIEAEPAGPAESPVPPPRKNRKALAVIVPILLAVAFIALYTGGIAAYKAREGTVVTENESVEPANGLDIQAIPTSLDTARNELNVRLLITPTGSIADEAGAPTQDITLFINAYGGNTLIELKQGKSISPQEVRLFADGHLSQYPLDSYVADLAIVAGNADLTEVIETAAYVPTGVQGWSLSVNSPSSEDGLTNVTMTLSRPFVSVVFISFILFLFVLIATGTVTIAGLVIKRKRKMELGLLGAGTALLFALPSMRNALPGSPPIGAWIDVTVFLWVYALAILTYLIFLTMWVRTSKPPE